MFQTALFPEMVDASPTTRTIRVAVDARTGAPIVGAPIVGAPIVGAPASGARAEALGEQKDIRYFAAAARSVLNGPETTGMGYWSVNPYVGCAFGCAYCYARYAHRYVTERRGADVVAAEGMPSWLAFERRIFVKQNAPELLRAALRPRRGRRHPMLERRETVVIGTATDPYQPAERRFRVTRGLLEALAEQEGLRVVIITKSPLVTRDVDVLSRLATRSSIGIHVSLITLDRELARRLEPRAPTPESRLRAIARLREAGIEVGVNVMPVLPGITDRPSDLEALVRAIAEAGANFAGACALRLQSEARKRYLPFIEAEFPSLAERYRGAYGRGYQVGERYRAGLRRVFGELCERYGVGIWGRDEDDADDDERTDVDSSGGQLGLEL